MVGRRAQHPRVGSGVSALLRYCHCCRQDKDVLQFRKYRGRLMDRCIDCKSRRKSAPEAVKETFLNLAVDAWKGRVDRTRNLTPII